MTLLRFDEPQLVAQLEGLPTGLRTAFAASCAERLFPAYVRFSRRTAWGDPKSLAAILERVWRDLEGDDEMSAEQVQEDLRLCMTLIPGEDDCLPWMSDQAYAEDAATALAYVLRCRLEGQAREAGWAARCAYEALDHYVINEADIDPNRPGGEGEVLSHALMQAELKRQDRDLEQLLRWNAANVFMQIASLRRRAKEEAESTFGSASA
jgi:uncharacterized protein YjaG (DUF416 family)